MSLEPAPLDLAELVRVAVSGIELLVEERDVRPDRRGPRYAAIYG